MKTSTKIRQEMTFADKMNAGINPYVDFVVESTEYYLKRNVDVWFEFACFLQLVRMNSDVENYSNFRSKIFVRLDECIGDDLVEHDLDLPDDLNVPNNLNMDPEELEYFYANWEDDLIDSKVEIDSQLLEIFEISRSWDDYVELSKTLGFDATSSSMKLRLVMAADDLSKDLGNLVCQMDLS